VLEMGEAIVVALVGDGQGIVLIAGKSAQIITPDLDFDLGEAFEEPGVASDGGDEDGLLRGGGLEAEEEGVFEVYEIEGVFAYDGGGSGEDAVLESIGSDDGLAFSGAWPGRFFGVETVGLDLFDGRHKITSINGSKQVREQMLLESCKWWIRWEIFIFCSREGLAKFGSKRIWPLLRGAGRPFFWRATC